MKGGEKGQLGFLFRRSPPNTKGNLPSPRKRKSERKFIWFFQEIPANQSVIGSEPHGGGGGGWPVEEDNQTFW